jgi:hypothetical protein
MKIQTCKILFVFSDLYKRIKTDRLNKQDIINLLQNQLILKLINYC